MNDHQKTIAHACLKGAEGDTMNFPQIVGALIGAGFEGYGIDLRRATATYYLPDGATLELATQAVSSPIAPTFDTSLMQSAIRDAQEQVSGYTYRGFCEKAASAGCVAYIVSFPGRRALYIGRTAETHVEPFPTP